MAPRLLHASGAVIGWTAPAAMGGKGSQDIWSNQPAGKYYASMHAVLPRPPKVPARHGNQPRPPRAPGANGYERYLRG